ncbi:MAG: HAD family phosphatase [Pirellulales bacterium]
MPASPDFYYFDLGNVLLSFSHEQGHRQMAAVAGAELSKVVDYFTNDARQLAYEAGQISTEAMIDGFQQATGTRPDPSELLLAAGDIFEPIADSVAILLAMRAEGRRLGLLSNTCDAHWRVCSDGRYPFLEQTFEQVILSFEHRVAKPDAEIYRIAARRCGLPPERIFFVDDRPENVRAACQVGFDAVLFEGPDQLRDDLARRGVDSPHLSRG